MKNEQAIDAYKQEMNEAAKAKWLDDYEKNKIARTRAIESAIMDFAMMPSPNLVSLSENYKGYGDDPKIADTLLDELKKRNLNEAYDNFEIYLKSIKYRKPWLFK